MPRTMMTCLPVAWVALLASSLATAQAPKTEPYGKPDSQGTSKAKVPARPLGPSGMGGRGVITPVTLIAVGAVQAELKLTEAQKRAIIGVNASLDKKRLESARALTKDPQTVNPDALMAMIASSRAENENAIAKVLDPRQRARLAQIAIQLEGPLAVARPEVAAKLNMAPGQEEAIREILEQYEQADGQLWRTHVKRIGSDQGEEREPSRVPGDAGPKGKANRAPRGPTPDGDALKARETETPAARLSRESNSLQDEAVRQVGRVLTRRQKAVFGRMLGEPFDLAKLQPGGGGGSDGALPPADAPTHLEPIPPQKPAGAAPAPRPPATAAGGEKGAPRSGKP